MILFNEAPSHLRIADFPIYGTILQKLCMFSHADDFAFVQHQNEVAVHDGADSLRHDDERGIFEILRDGSAKVGIGAVIEGGGRVVQNEDLRP